MYKPLKNVVTRTSPPTGFYRAPTTCPRRPFHASAPRGFLLDQIVPFAHEIFQSVHSVTGLPWGLSIPLVSILLNASVALPLQYISLREVKKQADLNPLIYTWRNKFRQDVAEEQKQQRVKISPDVANQKVRAQMEPQMKKIFNKYQVRPYFRYVPSLQVLAWLPFMDSLRCMSGQKSLFLNSTEADHYKELGFESGGILWFDNLLAYDLTLTLLTALVSWLRLGGIDTIKNTLYANQPGYEPTRQTTRSPALRRVRLLYPFCIPVVALVAQLPSALMLFWVSGTTFSIPATHYLFREVVGKRSLFKAAERKEVEMKRDSEDKI